MDPRALALFAEPEHQPFDFGPTEAETGVLLVHGFMGTPAELRPLGQALAAAGCRAVGPLLPGFGSQMPRLAHTRRQHWLNAVQSAWDNLKHTTHRQVLIGFSLGGALAVQFAHTAQPDFLVLIAPFWKMDAWFVPLVPVARFFVKAIRPFEQADFSDPDIRRGFERFSPDIDLDDPDVQTFIRHEWTLPSDAIHESFQAGFEGFRHAPFVSAPTLVIQGAHDDLVKPHFTRHYITRLPNLTAYHEIPGEHEIVQPHAPQHAEVSRLVLETLARRLPIHTTEPAFA